MKPKYTLSTLLTPKYFLSVIATLLSIGFTLLWHSRHAMCVLPIFLCKFVYQNYKGFLLALVYVFVFITIPFVLLGSLLWWLIAVVLIKSQHGNVPLLQTDWFFTSGDSDAENCNVYQLTIDGVLDYSRIKSVVQDSFVRKNPLSQRHICKKYGYRFWEKDDNFAVDSHLVFYENLKATTRNQVTELVNKHYQSSFSPSESPWLVIVIPHAPGFEKHQEPSYTMVLIAHKALADAYSFLEALVATNEKPKVAVPSKLPEEDWYNAYLHLAFIFHFPWLVIQASFLSNFLHFNPATMSGIKKSSTSKNFSANVVQKLRSAVGIPFDTVLLPSCIGGGLKKFLERRHVPIQNRFFYCTSSFSKVGTNSVRVIRLPVAHVTTAKERLGAHQECIDEPYNNTWKDLGAMLRFLSMILPNDFGRFLFHKRATEVYVEAGGIVSDSVPILDNGNQVAQVAISPAVNKQIGIAVSAFTLGHKIHVTVNMDSSLATQAEVDFLLQAMEEELTELDQSIVTINSDTP